MSSLKIRLRNAERKPLADAVRILIYRQRDRKLVAEHTIERLAGITIEELSPTELYLVRAFPSKHRPVVRFARAGQEITLHCPVIPESVRRVHIYRLGELEQMIANHEELEREQVAGALNIWAKMKATPIGGALVSDHVKRITRINQDRIWFEPSSELYDSIREAVGSGFVEAPASLHELRGYRLIDSVKTEDLYGNLQLTFLESRGIPGELLVDADIDEAAGLLHLFQVIRNAITGEPTHPYDVHEILTFHQEIDTGYRLIV